MHTSLDALLFNPTAEVYEAGKGVPTSATILAPDHLHKLRMARAAEVLSWVAHPGLTVLDIGCGYGALEDALDGEARSISYLGIDPDAAMIATANGKASKGFKYEVGTLGTAVEAKNHYGVVMMIGVVAHLRDFTFLPQVLSYLATIGTKALILEWQDSTLYKGKFTSIPPSYFEKVACIRLSPRNTLSSGGDSTHTTLIPLV